jgi:hypothetical protein
MRTYPVTIFLALSLAGALLAQNAQNAPKLPADVDPKSNSRLPFVQPDQLTGDALRVYESLYPKGQDGKRRALTPGPTSASLYSPGFAETLDNLHGYLSRKSIIGNDMFQLCSLIAVREFDDPFNWNAHEGGAIRAKVDQRSVDAIKFNRPVDGLPEKDALVIRFGRAIFRDHKVNPELYAQVVKTFGQQGMLELDATMGTYALVAVFMRGIDQQAPNAMYELPPLKH